MFSSLNKKFFWAAVILAVVIVLGGLVYITYSSYKAKIKSNENSNFPQTQQEPPAVSSQPGSESEVESIPEFEIVPKDEGGGGVILEKPLSDKAILMVIAFNDFKDKEYFTPKQYFLSAGAKTVLTASNQMGDATGSDGSKTPVNLLLKNINVFDFDAVVFVGGSGALQYLNNEDSYRIAREAKNQGKLLAAIAEASVILENAGASGDKTVIAKTANDSDIFAINIIDSLSQ